MPIKSQGAIQMPVRELERQGTAARLLTSTAPCLLHPSLHMPTKTDGQGAAVHLHVLALEIAGSSFTFDLTLVYLAITGNASASCRFVCVSSGSLRSRPVL